mgnify:CR=1 FL=1
MADNTATPTREDIRAKMLAHKGKTRIIRAYEMDIELRSPTVRQMIEATSSREGESREDATARASVMAIVAHCYVPGTTSRIFTDADVEALMALPMDTDYRDLQEAISEMMGIKRVVEEQVKN